MTGPACHSIEVADKAAFLHRLMLELAGNSMISLEGDLSACTFARSLDMPRGARGWPARCCVFPRLDFAVLRLAPDSVEPIFEQILRSGTNAILHITIVREGITQLETHDNFDGVWTGPEVAISLLAALKAQSVIHSFEVLPDAGPE